MLPEADASTIKDAAAYGLILTQGHGTFGTLQRLDAVDDPLRPDDGGRAVRHRGRRAGRRAHREHERDAIRSSS